MTESFKFVIKQLLSDFEFEGIEFAVSFPEHKGHGDLTTNVALILAKKTKKSPFAIAEEIKSRILLKRDQINSIVKEDEAESSGQAESEKEAGQLLAAVDRVEIASPGFINIFLSPAYFLKQLAVMSAKKDSAFIAQQNNRHQRIMVEFAHPNTHKAFHIGHLRNITTGESLVRLLQMNGYEVTRANYQGDVGMHIAKCLYGIIQVKSEKLEVKSFITEWNNKSLCDRITFLGESYVLGSKAFEESDNVKKEIGQINKKIYAKDPDVFPLYEETRKWSLDYFETIYKRVGSHFDRYYFESEVYDSGKQIVTEALEKGIFEKSDGAIIFPGKKYGLHNRVFITSEGNPTYEGKDVGLAKLQFAEFNPQRIIHVVGPEQAGYFQVIFKALEQVLPETTGKEFHQVYGFVKLKEGKMSSRLGQVILGEWLLDEVKKNVNDILNKNESKYTKEDQELISEKVAIAAVKYSFLKVAIKNDIAFDINESINLEGDSGPYLLYTVARCRSVLNKIQNEKFKMKNEAENYQLNHEERSVLRLISQYESIVMHAAQSMAPNLICGYLNELARAFNLFYAKHSILGTDKMRETEAAVNLRIQLVSVVAQVLHEGLYLLGIETVERM